MTLSLRNLARLILVASLLAAPGLSVAAPPAAPPPPSPEAKRAAELKQQGDSAMVEKRYEDALAAYDAAHAASADPVLHYNRGRALQFLARYPEALAALRRFEAEAPEDVRARVPGLAEVLADVRARVAKVQVKCQVAGARVLIAKRDIGVTPQDAPLAVNAGRVMVEVLADGYLPFRREVELKGDEALNVVDAALTTKSTRGLLVVRSRVAGARVAVDGRPVGIAPAESSLQAGRHAVVISHEDHDPASTQVVVVAGERREVIVDPIKRPPFYAKWWFWTAVGVAAAGAAVTYIVVTTERSPTPGSFSPGVVEF